MTNTSRNERTPNIPRIPAFPGPRGPMAGNANAKPRPPAGGPAADGTRGPPAAQTPAAQPSASIELVLAAVKDLRSEFHGFKRTRSKYRRGIAAAIIATIASAMVAFAAISGSTSSLAALFGEGYSANESLFTVTSQGALLNVLAVSADGDSQGGAIEMAASAGTATEAISAVHWYYQITMAEAAVNSVTSHANYSVTLYQNGTSIGVLYLKQNTFVDSSVESAVLRWSLGASVPAASGYTVKVLSI